MKNFKKIFIILLIVLSPFSLSAEEIANYAGCEVCNGAIHLTIPETKALMGIEGVMATLKLPIPNSKKIKIDIDGKLENGTKDTPDKGYEIVIWGSEIFFIQDLNDHSTIQMLTSRGQIPGSDNMASFQPHIYLDAGYDYSIDLDDSLEVAWEKFRHTDIYKWVGKTQNKKDWLQNLREKIFQAMEMMGKAK